MGKRFYWLFYVFATLHRGETLHWDWKLWVAQILLVLFSVVQRRLVFISRWVVILPCVMRVALSECLRRVRILRVDYLLPICFESRCWEGFLKL